MVADNDRGQELRANRLWSKIAIFLERGNRDAKNVADVLQVIHDDRNFAEKLLVLPAAERAPKKSASVPVVTIPSVRRLLRSWSKFYHRYFGIQPDFSGLMIPPRPEGFDFLIVVLKGITSNLVYAVMSSHFQCWKSWDNLDSIKSDRDSTQTYAIWVRNRQEADEELKNLSADKIQEMGLKTETLPERLLHGFKFWDESHTHLDIQNRTLCAGSRCVSSNGSVGVPCVHWDPSGGGLGVGWFGPSFAGGALRARQVVS